MKRFIAVFKKLFEFPREFEMIPVRPIKLILPECAKKFSIVETFRCPSYETYVPTHGLLHCINRIKKARKNNPNEKTIIITNGRISFELQEIMVEEGITFIMRCPMEEPNEKKNV